MFLTRIFCLNVTHANGYCNTWPGCAISDSVSPLTIMVSESKIFPMPGLKVNKCLPCIWIAQKYQGHMNLKEYLRYNLCGFRTEVWMDWRCFCRRFWLWELYLTSTLKSVEKYKFWYNLLEKCRCSIWLISNFCHPDRKVAQNKI